MTTKEIFIPAPRIETTDKTFRLVSDIEVNGEKRPLWVEVESQYGEYLCPERSDAFVIGLLHYAMSNGFDIRCEAPMGAQLLYQIRTYLIPSLVRHSKVMHETKIVAELDATEIKNAGGVGTGISCGVDSLHAVMNYANSEYPGLKLTHLVLNNVGAYWKRDGDKQFKWQSHHAMEFCREYGFKLILVNSNYDETFPQSHLFSNTYANAFVVYALRKLWSVYFYASGGQSDFQGFSVTDAECHDSAYYDLLSLDVFSTNGLRFYSEGGAMTRFEKTSALTEYAPSYKYLHVCANDNGPNCGHCRKCLRTLTTLDALGAVDKYVDVFDVAEYKRNWRRNMLWLYRQHVMPNGDAYIEETYTVMRPRIGLWRIFCFRLYVFAAGIYGKIRKLAIAD